MADDERRCDKCEFWNRGYDIAWCMRYPPQLTELAGCVGQREGWPTTQASDWCGEFRDAAKPYPAPDGGGE